MEPLILIVSLLFFLSYAGLIAYYRKNWLNIPPFNHTEMMVSKTTITVIIPARNEDQNIVACLNSIVQQSYPKHLFNVLVIDDHSTDNTPGVILKFKDQNVQLISLIEYVGANELNSYKKKAIEIAIQQASGELIVTTDADCIVPKNWLQTIAACYEEKKPQFIVMPVTINCSNKFIELFQALDFMTLQGITGASVYKKVHSMCNGANLAYTKKAFEEVNGFKGIDGIASGDDMLLMHKIFTRFRDNIAYLKSNQVIVQTKPVQTIGQFFNQRIRWASKADKYDDTRIFAVLLLVYFFNCWLLLLGLGAIFFSFGHIFLALLIGKTLIELYFLYPVAGFFDKKIILWWFPLAQPFHIIYTIIAGWLGKFGSYTWKERTVK